MRRGSLFSVLPQEGAAAQDLVPVVEDRGLAGGHGPLGLIKAEADGAAIQGDRLSILLPLAVAELHPAADGPRRRLPGDPVEVPRQGLPAADSGRSSAAGYRCRWCRRT